MPPKNRKMPSANDAKTNGKIDKAKFAAQLPAAGEAITSGESTLHKVVIEMDKGKLRAEIHRSHSHRTDGFPPKFSLALQNFLASIVSDGTVQLGDMSEAPSSDKDVLTLQSA